MDFKRFLKLEVAKVFNQNCQICIKINLFAPASTIAEKVLGNIDQNFFYRQLEKEKPPKTKIWTTTLRRGGGGAIFPTSDDLQIFFGALHHEIVRTFPEHKGSDDF